MAKHLYKLGAGGASTQAELRAADYAFNIEYFGGKRTARPHKRQPASKHASILAKLKVVGR